MADSLNDKNMTIDNIEMNNKLAYSYFDVAKIKANFLGLSVKVTENIEKELVKK